MKKFLSLCLVLLMMLSIVPSAEGYEMGQPYRKDLSAFMKDPQRRQYVQMMLDHYIRTDTMVQQALEGGFSAVFLFDGGSDHMDDPSLSDLNFFRVTGVCVVIRLDASGEPRMVYFNDNASTIPDRPLEYGAWALPEVGEVGPATVCDGTYQIYSVYHKGKYEALHMRTEYFDWMIDAVYMNPEGFVKARASEINVHTRNSNHVSGVGMWSAGCPLVGDGDNWEFWKLVYSVYDTTYGEAFEVDNFLGTITIDRQMLKQELYELYENEEAVDTFLEHSDNQQPEQYLARCSDDKTYEKAEKKVCGRDTQLMTLPCSNATDARALLLKTIPEGTEVKIMGSIVNSAGNEWLKVSVDGMDGYLYSGHMKKESWVDRLFDKLFT